MGEDKPGFVKRLRGGYHRLVADYYKWRLKRAGEYAAYYLKMGMDREEWAGLFSSLEEVRSGESLPGIYDSAEILCAELDRLYTTAGKSRLHDEADELFERKGLYDKKSDSHYTLQTQHAKSSTNSKLLDLP